MSATFLLRALVRICSLFFRHFPFFYSFLPHRLISDPQLATQLGYTAEELEELVARFMKDGRVSATRDL